MASTSLMVLTAGTDFSIPLQAYDTRYDQKSTENLQKFLRCEQHVVLAVNVMHLGDPHHDPNLRGHIGTHPETLRGVVQSKHSMEVLSKCPSKALGPPHVPCLSKDSKTGVFTPCEGTPKPQLKTTLPKQA